MIRRPPRSTLFPTRRSSDLHDVDPVRDLHRDRQLLLDQQDGDAGLRDPRDQLADLLHDQRRDRKSTRLNSSHSSISYAVFCLKKKKKTKSQTETTTSTQCTV